MQEEIETKIITSRWLFSFSFEAKNRWKARKKLLWVVLCLLFLCVCVCVQAISSCFFFSDFLTSLIFLHVIHFSPLIYSLPSSFGFCFFSCSELTQTQKNYIPRYNVISVPGIIYWIYIIIVWFLLHGMFDKVPWKNDAIFYA